MKIPTTPPGGAPYYHGPPVNGMEMNPQWQGNGVVIDGAAPGNGAAYLLPHVHPAGFVPATGFYAPGASPPAPAGGPAAQQDFSEYMWMENEEEFDKQVMQQLEEEALMEQCIEAMLADEREAQNRISSDISLEEQVSKSTLNPLAAEFVPTFLPSPVAVAGTSDQDAQPSVSILSSNTSKSIESSMSELSISQTSDAPTESSKSSTGDVPEEMCNLPLDATVIRYEREETESKKSKTEHTVVVSADAEDVEKSQKSSKIESEESSAPKEDPASKKSVEKETAKPKVEQPKTQPKQNQESKDSKPVPKSESAPASHKGGHPKSHDSKPDVTKKSEVSTAKVTQAKISGPGAPKGKVSETKPKEAESKPKVSTEAVIEATVTTPTTITPEVEKPQPAAPAVFNYAAAARANLPAKQSTPPAVAQQSSTPTASAQQPIVKQDSNAKEPQSNATQAQGASANSAKQLKPGVKQNKPNNNKDSAKGTPSTRGGPVGARKNKK